MYIYVLKRIDIVQFDLLLFNACLLKPLICLIKKLVLKTHRGNELNLKNPNWYKVGLPIYIQKKLYPITYKGFDFISYNL